ncbi:MAG: hypothetical protein IT365_05195 [Candidatus Hydrogenedentes bacterium]|nr:hypothetical protein [Candidatus Hydrogenedentota bacterium]
MESIRRRSAGWRRTADAFHDVVTNHCRRTHDTQQTFADETGVPLGTLSNMMCGHSPVPADIIVTVTNLTGENAILRAMGSLTGNLVLPMPRPGEHPEVDEVLRETGDVLRAYGEAIQDGTITEAEAARIVREIEEAQAALEAMKQRVVAAEVRKPQLRLKGVM